MSKENLPTFSSPAWTPASHSINSSKLRCESVSFREWLQTFRKIAVPSSSRVKTAVSSQDRCDKPQISHFAIRARFWACTAVNFGFSPSWRLVCYWRFGKAYRSHLQGSRHLDSWICPETLGLNKPKFRNNQNDGLLPFQIPFFFTTPDSTVLLLVVVPVCVLGSMAKLVTESLINLLKIVWKYQQF